MPRIAVLITSHNRREMTLACLDALVANRLPSAVTLAVILVDDGSTDGTSEAVRQRFPDVEVLPGTGHLYWNVGMRRAFGHALNAGFDAYLWLNDDTFLDPDALDRLVRIWRDERLAPGGMAILVGTTRDPDSGAITYGGLERHSNWRPLSFSPVLSADAPVECATMNGNCVLVPHRVAQVLGNLDSAFVHAMGDIDYGLRAGRAGIKVWVVPGYVGSCRAHQPTESPGEQAKRRPFLARWNETLGPKRLPPRAWMTLVRRHGGLLWPIYWASPYIKVFLR